MTDDNTPDTADTADTAETTDTAESDNDYVMAPSPNNPTRGAEDAPDEEATAHDNDADSRPFIFGRVATPAGEVELTVEGAEDESVRDVSDEFDAKLRQLVQAQQDFMTEDEDTSSRTFN